MKLFLDFRKIVIEDPGNDAAAQLPILKQEIIDVVYMRMMGFGEGRYIIRQLHQLQKDSILLLNLIHCTQQKSECHVIAKQCLIEILESLQRYKGKYFNREMTVPAYLIDEISPMLVEKTQLMEAGMKRKEIDSELLQVVLDPFLNFGKKGYSSYQQMEYLLRQADELISIVQHGKKYGEDLTYFLLRNGFNTDGFNRYYMLKIAAEVHAAYLTDEQFDTLFEYKRSFTVMPKKPYRYYNLLGPNTRDTLLKFVNTELRYLDRKRDLSAPKVDVFPAVISNYRIKTSLSVDGFAFLFRLLVENEAIEANPRTELMFFLASHLQTCGKEAAISPKSLYTKYRQVTQTTAIGIRSLLVKMTKQIEADFSI